LWRHSRHTGQVRQYKWKVVERSRFFALIIPRIDMVLVMLGETKRTKPRDEAVVEALKTHVASLAVQVEGCEALMLLCYDNAEYRCGFDGAWGVVAIVEAIEAHRGNAAERVEGCGALVALASNHDQKKLFP
jgi:hypothetical protein